ncbi:unnamed protein product [Durusdinium trenchii]|uniref:Protein-L-histidine N-pros-methyltransferase (DORA reverse strand protein) (DREV) (Methyltransferase-like protein 9) (MMETTL9) n=2 Tax=Durusdinium trenchii TaxID=1381693 RepID=A0ABP0K8Z3_9DINO
MTGPSLLGDVSVTHNWERASSVYCCRSQHFCRPRELRYGHGQLSPDLASKWVTLDRDEATNAFLENCLAGHLGPRLLDICKLAPLRILRWYFSATDANALLGRGEMFVLSSDQAQRLLGAGTSGVLLDIGAGAGHTTSELAQLFDQVVATEVSGPMVTKLEARGFPVLQGSDLSGLQDLAALHGIALGEGGLVDCIALMNVLDRCDRPLSLLEEIRERLKPDGRLLLAVVLPFRPFVENGIFHLQPSEQLNLSRNAIFEYAMEEIWLSVLKPMGFHLQAVARVPYLCKGDLFANVYVLDDAIFVLSRA